MNLSPMKNLDSKTIELNSFKSLFLSSIKNKHPSQIEALRILVGTSLWYIIHDYFISTREFEQGLEFEQICNNIMVTHENEVANEEKTDWKIKLIGFRLEMLDRLNHWEDYVSCFESYLDSKLYVVKYAKSITGPALANEPLPETFLSGVKRDDARFGSYLVSEDERVKYVNFLYLHNRRYETIKRKVDRLRKGKSVEHLKRYQSNALSDEEYNERIHIFLNRLEQYINDNHLQT